MHPVVLAMPVVRGGAPVRVLGICEPGTVATAVGLGLPESFVACVQLAVCDSVNSLSQHDRGPVPTLSHWMGCAAKDRCCYLSLSNEFCFFLL